MTDDNKRHAYVVHWASDERDPPTLRPAISYDEAQPLFDFAKHNRCRDCGNGGNIAMAIEGPRGAALPECRRKECVAAREARRRAIANGSRGGAAFRELGPDVGGTLRGKS